MATQLQESQGERRERNTLYLLLSKEHRVSRSVRVSWLFKHLFTDIHLLQNKDKTEGKDESIQVLHNHSDRTNSNSSSSISDSSVTNEVFLPSTDLFYIAQNCSLVFVIDMTPSMIQVSNETFYVKLDEAILTLEKVLHDLIDDVIVGGVTIEPYLCITVIAYTGLNLPKKPVEVMLQGVHLHKDNITQLITLIKEHLHRLETRPTQQQQVPTTPNTSHSHQLSPDTGLDAIIKTGLLAIQLLPRSDIKGIVVLTDGVGGFTTPTSAHQLINQMRCTNVSCWVILCGGVVSTNISLGSVIDSQLLEHVAVSCCGCVLDPYMVQHSTNSGDITLNPVQQCILVWTLQCSAWEGRVRGVALSHPRYEDSFVPQSEYKYQRLLVKAPPLRVIGCRIREGFLIKSINVSESEIEVVMWYPWQPDISINYVIQMSFPIDDNDTHSSVTISFSAPYHFVRDFLNESEHMRAGTHHSNALRRFRQSLKNLSQSDEVLFHLLSFSAVSDYYTLPQVIVDGMPLLCVVPNQSKPVLAIEGNDKSLHTLANYWRSLCTLDINLWTHWFHTYKIPLVLNQDSSLPDHLVHPSSTGRYSSIQCRVSASKLFSLLKSWSTIVLQESHSYVKLFPDPANPAYFCLARVVQLHPCLLIHLGFLEGTPWDLQQDILTLLKGSISRLRLSLPSSDHFTSGGGGRSGKKRAGSTSLPHQPCAIRIRKQLQKALISYNHSSEEPSLQCGYMRHYRWKWRVPNAHPILISALLRRRLSEGFVIARAHNGIITLVVEIEIKQPTSQAVYPCLLQYVISPVNSIGIFCTEVWVEPQYLAVSKAPHGLKYLENVKVDDIHYKIHCVDLNTLTALCSYLEHSSYPPLPPLSSPLRHEASIPSLFEQLTSGQYVDVHVKLSSLYSTCHVTGLTFSAFTESHDASSQQPITLDNCSPINRTLHIRFLELLQQQLACNSVHVTEPNLVMERLNQSNELNQFVELFSSAQDGGRLLWRGFTFSKNDNLYIIFTPCFLCHISSLSNLTLPLVVMVTNLAILLGPDHTGGVVEPHPPDVYLNELFTSDDTKTTPPALIKEVWSELKLVHKLSYLHSLQTALHLSEGFVNEDDLTRGLNISTRVTITIDITPLLIAVCRHIGLYNKEEEKKGERVTSLLISQLLETLGSYRSDICKAILFSGEEEGCERREGEISDMLLGFLSELGFRTIRSSISGHFWLSDSNNNNNDNSSRMEKESTPVRLDSLVSQSPPPSPRSPNHTLSQSPPSKYFSPDTTLKPKLTLPIPLPERGREGEGGGEGDSFDEFCLIEPILSPLADPVVMTTASNYLTPPLFLNLSYSLLHEQVKEDNDEKREEGEEKGERERNGEREERGNLQESRIPLCLSALLSEYQLSHGTTACRLQLTLEFYSLLPTSQTTASITSSNTGKNDTLTESGDERNEETGKTSDPFSGIHPNYQSTAKSLKRKIEWLIHDELLSRARELVGEGDSVPPSLLQSVASHVQSSSNKFVNCIYNQEPIKFVFGEKKSKNQFLQQLEEMKLTNYLVHKSNEDYFYLTPNTTSLLAPPTSFRHHSASPLTPQYKKLFTHDRCSTPSPAPVKTTWGTHKRSVSWTAAPTNTYPLSSSLSLFPPFRNFVSRSSLDSIPSTNDYDASRSNSISCPSFPLSPIDRSMSEEVFWLVMRVLPSQVGVYLHSRCSVNNQLLLTEGSEGMNKLCQQIMEAIRRVCIRTNQWHLLKELLDKHECSPLLLPESQSDEWVGRTISHHGDIITSSGDRFTPQQFECEIQWRHHITPHWRLRTMKTQIALHITRLALDAFAVTNRQDLFVLQDVSEGGEETIFYLKISESLCEVEGDYCEQDEGGGGGGGGGGEETRCDTRATEADTISISSVGEPHHQSLVHHKLSGSSLSIVKDTKARESIVLELFGITVPSATLKSRLQRVIQLKLDDKALETMCSSYLRNQKLLLSPADIEFLQPSPDQPSEVVSLILPSWLTNPHVFFYYLLQQLLFVFLPPQYTPGGGERMGKVCLQTPTDLSQVLEATGLPLDIQQDYLFIYIRPVTRGRGMALISASLVSPEGRVLPPQPGINLKPHPLSTPPTLDETTSVEMKESFPCIGETFSIAFHIWERGNVGLMELKQKLTQTVQRSLLDTSFESHFLHLPVARINEEEIERRLSPGLLRASFSKTSSLDRSSYVDLTLNSSLDSGRIEQEIDDAMNSASLTEIIEEKEEKREEKREKKEKREEREEKREKREKKGEKEEKREGREEKREEKEKREKEIEKRREERDEGEKREKREKKEKKREDKVEKEEKREEKKEKKEENEKREKEIEKRREEESEGGGGDWEQKEKQRRIQLARESLLHQAHCGLLGELNDEYIHNMIPFLNKMKSFTSPVLYTDSWTLPSNYSINTTLTHAHSLLSSLLPEMAFNLFKHQITRYIRIPSPLDTPLSDHTHPNSYILIGRDLVQWKESTDPTDPNKHYEEVWSNCLSCLPLASWKNEPLVGVVPLMGVARRHNSFISRHQFMMCKIECGKFEIWLYNSTEYRLKQIKLKLSNLIKWQRARAGLLHQMLPQKVGLFHHTSSQSDLLIKTSVNESSRYCSTFGSIHSLVKNSKPVEEEREKISGVSSSRSKAPPTSTLVQLDSFYHDRQPSHMTASHDPVRCHGHQFLEMFNRQRQTSKQEELLGKVFESWEQRGIDYSAPISCEVVTKLKRTSRLLHFCSSPLLLFSDCNDTQDEEEHIWQRSVKEKYLTEYTSYLQTLKFNPINERPPALPRSHHAPSPSPSTSSETFELYKCLQRSWSSGGIMLIELLFKESVFHVMLYSIECSRLIKSDITSFEASGLFSTECSRMKDYIHVHSFTYDFHIRIIHGIIQGRLRIDGTLNLHHLLDRFCKHYHSPPNYIRNRICKDTLIQNVSVTKDSLFKHILSHCKEYSLQTFELIHTDEAMDTPSTLYDVALMIDLSQIGNITTPEISRLINETRDQYHVVILAIPSDQSDSSSACQDSSSAHKTVSLNIYMILVNKVDMYPRLTIFSPFVTRHASSLISSNRYDEVIPVTREKESKLNVSVRDHRRKLGYGSLNTPSAGSEVVINVGVIHEQMNGLKRHFQNVVNSAQCHVRRNELWKRLLYGGGPSKIAEMDSLSCIEFQEVLQLVSVCRLETIDRGLLPLQKQSKKWYRSLFQPLEDKFQHTFKLFQSLSNDDKYAVIINEDWQDMFILLTSDESGHDQGFSSVYRNPQNIPQEQRNITSYVEADHAHISSVVNFACSYLWLKIVTDTPTIKVKSNSGKTSS